MKKNMFTTDDFDYDLPLNLIAQQPASERDISNLLVPHQNNEIMPFFKIIDFFDENDILVFNQTKVMQARVSGYNSVKGTQHEILFLEDLGQNRWNVMLGKARKLKNGDELILASDLKLQIIEKKGYSNEVIFHGSVSPYAYMEKHGKMPVPPYIKREDHKDDELDMDRYQTVYSKVIGSSAAPTAGLHFSKSIIKKLKDKGVTVLYVTLHVGIGTFLPVKVSDISEHKMHKEWIELSESNASILTEAKRNNKRITAVGTTSLRVLESCYKNEGFDPYKGYTDIFISPPTKVLSANRLITNFHQPKSTLLMLVSAFAGYDFVKQAYQTAVNKKMRFFSYGDSTLWENEALG